MVWTNVPPATGIDINAYSWLNQFWEAVQERNWGAGAWAWPQSNHVWATGFVTGLTLNGDGSYTVTDSAASYAVNRYYGYSDPSNPWIPAFYDLIIDDPFDETQCIHTSITANTATTFTVTGQVFADALTSKFLTSTSSLVGRRYWVIKRGGEWWSERWLVWPNDSEAWVGTTLGAGAIVPIKLTSSGTTATATLPTGHGFLNGDSVTIAGATSTNGRYNGTFTIGSVTSTSFQYTIAGTDSTPAGGAPTATYQYNGSNDPQARYVPGQFQSGYELMVKGSDGALKRIAITGNDGTNLFFARQTYTVSGQYAIIKAGQKWRFYNSNVSPAASTDGNPYAGPPFRWYHSYWDHYLSHYPDDSIQATPVPATSIRVQVPDGSGGCEAGSVPAFDLDVWTALDDACNTPDSNLTPDFFRTLHALQVALENVCTNYVKVQSYEGAAAIPTFVPATWFNASGINAFTSTTTTVGTDGHGNAGINIGSVTLPTPAQTKLATTGSIPVYFAVLDSTGTCQHSGSGNLTSNTFLTGTFIACSPPSPPANPGTGIGCNTVPPWCDESRTIILSLGWTRNFPAEFLYMYDRTAFVPQVNDLGTAFVDPPDTGHPGTWATRHKSTTYKEHDSIGMVRDANGWRAFQAGDFVRYSGDNANDPTIHEGISGTTLTNNQEDKTTSAPVPDPAPYFDNFYEGLLSPANQASVNGSRGGTATGGDSYSLQNTNTNWWPGGVMRTETGTASGGGTTSLSDSSKTGNAFWNASTGRWVGFTLEMLIGGTWYRRPITGMSGTTLSWSDPLPVSCNGCTYQIREPRYVLNRWAGRSVMVTLPNNGGTYTIPILYSDDQNIYFAAQSFSITKGTSYQIIEYYPGGVWKWDPTTLNPNNNTHWNVPTGNDTRSGSSVPWLPNQTCNLPTTRTDYGHVMKGDYISQGVFTELYNGLNQLVWVKWPMGWTGSANPPTCERNDIAATPIATDIVNVGSGSNYGSTGCLHGWTDTGSPPSYHPGAADLYGPGTNAYNDLYTTPDCATKGITEAGVPAYDMPDGIPDYLSEVDAAPRAWSFADNGSACCFTCNYNRRYAYGTVANIIPYQECGVDWYAYADVQGGCVVDGCVCGTDYSGNKTTFNAEGDGVLFQAWHKWATSAPSNAQSRISTALGTLSIPTDATVANNGGTPCAHCNYGCPGDDRTACTAAGYGAPIGPYCAHWDGYLITNQTAVLTWDNPAGFRFQTI